MALTVGGSPITPAQLATLQADLGIVVPEEISGRLTSLEGTDDAIFLRAGVPHLGAASIIAAFTGGGGAGAQTLTPARLNNAQTFYAPTVALGAAAYIAHTLNSGAGSITGTLPAGTTATDTLTAIVFNVTTGLGTLNTMAAPSGWTAQTGAVANSRSGRVFTAPGNVGTLTFAATGVEQLLIFATNAPLRAHDYQAIDSSTPGQVANHPTPSVAGAVLNDVAVSVYIQIDDGAGGALPDPGSPQASYTRRLLSNAAVPRISILSRASHPAGATGTVSHDASANFATRHLFTGVYGA
jgi:hypothetical protein